MLGGVRMMWPGMAPLVSGMPGSLPGDAGMPMYFRARSSMPAALSCLIAMQYLPRKGCRSAVYSFLLHPLVRELSLEEGAHNKTWELPPHTARAS